MDERCRIDPASGVRVNVLCVSDPVTRRVRLRSPHVRGFFVRQKARTTHGLPADRHGADRPAGRQEKEMTMPTAVEGIVRSASSRSAHPRWSSWPHPPMPLGSPPSRRKSIVPAAGGASDQMARTIEGVIMKHKLMKQPPMIFNKGGASGAEGATEVRVRMATPTNSSWLFPHLYPADRAESAADAGQLQPGGDDRFGRFYPVVSFQMRRTKTAKEYVSAIKAAPDNSFKMGGTGSKREDQIISVCIRKWSGRR